MITGPLAYIFAGVVVSTISHGIDLNSNIDENTEDYRKIRPLYIVQLVVILSLLVLSPINYFVAKATVAEEHDHHEEEDEIDYTDYKPEEWKIDIANPKVFDYADEFFFKPRFIRSYHSRKKCLGVIKHAFEMSALLYEHSHEDHDDHGHDDHDHDHHHSPEKTTELNSPGLDKQHFDESYNDDSDSEHDLTKEPMDRTLSQDNSLTSKPEIEAQSLKPEEDPTKVQPKLKKKTDLNEQLINELDLTYQQTEKSDSEESSEY